MLNPLALKKDLEKLYLQKKFSGYEITRQLGLPKTTLYRYLEQCKIPRRSNTEAQKLAHLNLEANLKRALTMKGKNTGARPEDVKRRIAQKLIGIGKGKKNSNWQGGEYRPCPICGKKVWVCPYHQDRPKYCSLRCSAIASLQKARPKPNKSEQSLIDLINQAKLPFKYTGDGKLVIGGMVPDFANCNGKKDLLELFGDYYHSPKVTSANWKRSELGRIMAYNSLGYRCLVIWEHELKEAEAVITKIKNWSRLP